MAVRVTSGTRQIALGRCVFLFLACTALADVMTQLLVAVAVPRDLSILGVPAGLWLPGLLGATMFTIAFRAFSEPAGSQGAA